MVLLTLALAGAAAGHSHAAHTHVARNATRILAYGDSLTAGFHDYGTRFHPYSTRLSERLGCEVDHIGLSGFTTAQMAGTPGGSSGEHDATGRTWVSLDAALQHGHYSHAVILAGTNDLGRLRHVGGPHTAESVVANIVSLHQRAHDAGTRTLALTVPQPAFEGGRLPLAQGRAEINEGLRQYAASNANVTALVDVATLLPNLDASPDERARLWEPDGLHFSPAGYDALADCVYDALVRAGVAPCGGGDAARNATGRALDIPRNVTLR